jgi:hypothetical protein
MKNIHTISALVIFCIFNGSAQANSLLGDKDGFGIGLVEGDIRPESEGFFDMRDPADPYFTDSYPVSQPGLYNFNYTHSFSMPSTPVTEAHLNLFTLGIQDGDDQIEGSDPDILLYIDGMEIPNAFDDIDQFDWFSEYGWTSIASLVTIDIPSNLLSALDDGNATLRFEIKQYGSHPGKDAFAIDYSELIIIPEPATISLLAIGAFLAGRKRK